MSALLAIYAAAHAAVSVPTLVERGNRVYQANCTVCHNPNPRLAGSLGPDVYGSSEDLLDARVLRGSYPVGYHPKRSTHVMPAMPSLKDDIAALAAYLNGDQ